MDKSFRQIPTQGPFALAEQAQYARWRDRRIVSYPFKKEEFFVDMANPMAPSGAERAKALSIVQRTNFFLYRASPSGSSGREVAQALARAFGFHRLDSNPMADDDGLTQVAVREQGPATRYIPYSDRPVQWHTDGYYNAPDRQIRGFLLHCEQDAKEGGESRLMDHEIAYILLRERDPALVAALFDPEAMTVPANEADGDQLRGARTGPVFSIDPSSGALHMRYTARTRSIVWRDDARVRVAARALAAILDDPASPYVVRHRLAPGEGVICNNVLHGRTGFVDDAPRRRLVWRARSYDRIVPV
jgi:alpha-ketoglutarate-dependent taurine dioxygenase